MKYYNLSKTVQVSTKDKTPFLELREDQKEKLKTLSEYALGILAVAGIASVSVVAPNLLGALDKLSKYRGGRKLSFKQKQNKVRRTFYYLKESGLVSLSESKGDLTIELSNKGKQRLQEVLNEIVIPKPGHWNKRWWQIAADIPTEDYRSGADRLRWYLKKLKFYPLQRTLWFYPYDPRVQIEALAGECGINPFVTAMEVSWVDKGDEKKLIQFFTSNGIL